MRKNRENNRNRLNRAAACAVLLGTVLTQPGAPTSGRELSVRTHLSAEARTELTRLARASRGRVRIHLSGGMLRIRLVPAARLASGLPTGPLHSLADWARRNGIELSVGTGETAISCTEGICAEKDSLRAGTGGVTVHLVASADVDRPQRTVSGQTRSPVARCPLAPEGCFARRAPPVG